MKQVMIDLETLGTRAGCKVLSIGAVVFSPAGLFDEFYCEIDRWSQLTLLEDPDTVKWWANQPAEVRDRLFLEGDTWHKFPLAEVLEHFGSWLGVVGGFDKRGKPDVCVWGNGADFDNAILHAAYAACGQPSPWDHWNNRCYRTLKSLRPDIKLVRQGALHNALDDAKSQAEHAVRILRSTEWLSPASTTGQSEKASSVVSPSPSSLRQMLSRLFRGRDTP